MPSKREIRKLYGNGQTICIELFFCLFTFFSVRRICSRRRRKASRRAWQLLHGKLSGRTVLCEAGIPMRKSGEKPYLEGIVSAPFTGPHSINGGSGNRARAANRRAAVPHFAEKGSEGPQTKQSRRITSRRLLHGLSLLPWRGAT